MDAYILLLESDLKKGFPLREFTASEFLYGGSEGPSLSLNYHATYQPYFQF